MDDGAQVREEQRALVYQNVSDVIFSIGVEGDDFRFLEINPAFTRATGLTPGRVVGKRVSEVIPEPSLSLVLRQYRTAILEKRTLRWDEVTEYPTGRKYGEVSVTPIVDGQGRCIRLVGTVHDVTEERQRAETVRLYGDMVEAVQIGLMVWNVPDHRDPRTITLAAVNPAAETLSGVDLSRRLGETLTSIFPKAEGSAALDLICETARRGVAGSLPAFRFVAGRKHTRFFSLKAFPLTGSRVGLAAEDVTADVRARCLKAIEQRVLEMVASGESLRDTLTALALAIEEEAPPAIASVLLVSPDGERVLEGAAPHLPPGYNRAIHGQPVGPRAGSCGTAVALGEPVIVTDIETDPLWDDYREIARAYQLRACWSTPIKTTGGRVIGTFALYYRRPRYPTAEDLELIARATHVAGLAIQRQELDDQMAALSARLDEAREQERTAIAREIHDRLGQSLTVLKLDLAAIKRRESSPDLVTRIDGTLGLADEMIEQVRRISSELRPGVLDDIGLLAALSWQAQEFEKRTQIACSVRSDLDDDEKLDRDVATTAFRVVQEALTNVARHAEARHVQVRMDHADGELVLQVRDDGRGIDPSIVRHPRSLGLLGIRERARRLGGTASFERVQPGTLVTLRVPLRPVAA